MPCNKRRDAFSDCHPAICFLYLAGVILISMFMSHPVILGLSFGGALAYSVCLKGWKKVVKFNIALTLPAMIIVAFVNPAFNHYGVTFLFYLKTGPVTLEAVVYGAVLASMLFIAILWFTCYNEVMTTDKFVYLFGRLIPALSLVLSMVFRFVPRFGAQANIIRNGQKAAGRDVSNGSLLKRIRYGVNILSILVTWALENAIETSDSMKARGYGLKGRTAFSIFRFDRRDGIVTAILVTLLALFISGSLSGVTYASYNPVISLGGLPLTWTGAITYLAWALFCFFPVIMRIGEVMTFKRLEQTADIKTTLPWYISQQEPAISNELYRSKEFQF